MAKVNWSFRSVRRVRRREERKEGIVGEWGGGGGRRRAGGNLEGDLEWRTRSLRVKMELEDLFLL